MLIVILILVFFLMLGSIRRHSRRTARATERVAHAIAPEPPSLFATVVNILFVLFVLWLLFALIFTPGTKLTGTAHAQSSFPEYSITAACTKHITEQYRLAPPSSHPPSASDPESMRICAHMETGQKELLSNIIWPKIGPQTRAFCTSVSYGYQELLQCVTTFWSTAQQ